jgi:Uma2 family endonuclease
MSAARPLSGSPDRTAIDHFVYLRVGWDGYEKLLAMRGESSVPRITYLKGVVELMSPSSHHERDKTRFARLLEACAEVANLRLEGYGSWTLTDEQEDCGAEPDECYTLNRLAAGESDRPEVAIEVVWTSGGINKLEVYRRLGVREVWFYEGGSLRFFALRGAKGHEDYAEIPSSETIPQLPLELLLACMREPDQTSALRALRAALREPEVQRSALLDGASREITLPSAGDRRILGSRRVLRLSIPPSSSRTPRGASRRPTHARRARMSLFGTILSKLGIGNATAATASPPPRMPPASQSPPPASAPPRPPAAPVDIAAQLEQLAAANPQKLNWRTSIVDLLKLLDMDSSLTARKALATELGCPPDLMGDSAQMNVWLHKAVLERVAENGGKVPQELLH